MRELYKMSDNEKKLLTVLGNRPELPLTALLAYTTYKRMSSVARHIKRFRECNMLWGPVHTVDYGKLCKNPIYKLYCIIELTQSYERAIPYLQLIEPLVWAYPVLSSHTELLNVGFLSSNNEKVTTLLQMLKDNNIIAQFSVRPCGQRGVINNPDFFGDAMPSLDNLLEPCDLLDMSLGCYHTVWSDCDIRTLSYLQGFNAMKLIDIMRKERKLNREWTYEQIKYAREKIIKNKLVEKNYLVAPFPQHQCADFYLFIKTEDITLTQRILSNFAKGGRIHKEYTLCGDWGIAGFMSHPLFLTDLMHKLDQVEEIYEKELYHIRSFPPGVLYVGEHAEFNWYDVDTQTLEYPYHVFKEKIKEHLEREE